MSMKRGTDQPMAMIGLTGRQPVPAKLRLFRIFDTDCVQMPLRVQTYAAAVDPACRVNVASGTSITASLQDPATPVSCPAGC